MFLNGRERVDRNDYLVCKQRWLAWSGGLFWLLEVAVGGLGWVARLKWKDLAIELVDG